MHKVKITKLDVTEDKRERRVDVVAEEAPLHVFLDQTRVVSFLCSPDKLKELTVGFLFSEGFLHNLDEVQEVRLEDKNRCFVTLKSAVDVKKRLELVQPFGRLVISACDSADLWPFAKLIDRVKGLRVKSDAVVSAKVIAECIRGLNSLAEMYKRTGGVHVASLNRIDGSLVAAAEDVGRHNAVDKVIGVGVLGRVNFEQCFLALSGRLSWDVVLKCARTGIPVAASRGAALSGGVEVARRCGVGLVGFVRAGRMNVYACPERVTL
jgi:FdhD protein